MFITLTMLFGLLLLLISKAEPQCVTSKIFKNDASFMAKFNDAWQLSWTTFATVGYGGISPATSAMFMDDMITFRENGSCALTGVMLSFESLVGILFVSCAGAIMYAKLTQFQSNAQVKFSKVMVVRYGSGVQENDIDTDSDSDDDGDDPNDPKKIPCPVLEFRMANLLHSAHSGEIINANVSTVATIDIKNSLSKQIPTDILFRNALQSNRKLMHNMDKPNTGIMSGSLHRFPRQLNRGGATTTKMPHAKSVPVLNNLSKNKSTMRFFGRKQKESPEDAINDSKRSQSLIQHGMTNDQIGSLETVFSNEEQEVNDLLGSIIIHPEAQVDRPNLVFSNVSVAPATHPYFRTSWRVMHTLNEDSPLLSRALRKKIKKGGGYWPDEMNNKEDVEESISFDQFLVSFTGMAKSTGNEVYEHHVYKKKDLRVGKQFRSILSENVNGGISVETDAINDIKSQDG
jgi:hypothetical protein